MIDYVVKRNGTTEAFQPEKLNKWCQWASENGSNWSEIAFKVNKLLTGTVSSKDIQETILYVCNQSDKKVDHDLGARIQIGVIYKEVFGGFNNIPSLCTFYDDMVDKGIWADMGYTDLELMSLGNVIDHQADFTYSFAALKQLYEKYLLKNEITKQHFETPQFMKMGLALFLMKDMPKSRRLTDVRKMYNLLKDNKISLPTPILASGRTGINKFASCCLLTCSDEADSIGVMNYLAYSMTTAHAGIGGYLHTRSLGDPVNGGMIKHEGKLPYLEYMKSAIGSTKQKGRRGAGTFYYTIHDPEIKSLLELKHVNTPDSRQIRELDFAVNMNKLFIQKALQGEDWMLISPYYAENLYQLFFSKDQAAYEAEYNRLCSDDSVVKTFVKARDLMNLANKQWYETGRIYKEFIDNANHHTPFKEPIYSSNLCLEINLPTKPFKDVSYLTHNYDSLDAGEVALCFIGAICAGRVTEAEYFEAAYYLLLALDNCIEDMEYPFPSIAYTAKQRRSVGIGIINLANHMAKNGQRYSTLEGKKFIHQHAEMHSYYLHKASLQLAKERGNAGWIDKTNYPEGWLPIDTYSRACDSITTDLKYDWEALRKEIIAQGGIRNSVLEATMPAESSAIQADATNSLYPIRDYMIKKGDKDKMLKVFAPDLDNAKAVYYYEKLWSVSVQDLIECYAMVQKFHGQGISVDVPFNPDDYVDGKIGTRDQLIMIANMAKWGLKGHYYLNTKSSGDGDAEAPEIACGSGGCTL